MGWLLCLGREYGVMNGVWVRLDRRRWDEGIVRYVRVWTRRSLVVTWQRRAYRQRL